MFDSTTKLVSVSAGQPGRPPTGASTARESPRGGRGRGVSREGAVRGDRVARVGGARVAGAVDRVENLLAAMGRLALIQQTLRLGRVVGEAGHLTHQDERDAEPCVDEA